jgi:hypothetical protein
MNAMLLVRGMGQSNAVAVSRLRLATFVLVGLSGSAAFALDGELPRPQLEVTATTLPRFDSVDNATSSSRLDMTWLPPRRSALGLSLGMTSPDGLGLAPFAPRNGPTQSVDLGLHWRYTLDSNYRVDVTAWRRLVPPDALTMVQTHEPTYGARVEMQLGSGGKRGLVADRGFLGLQLESGARLTLKRSGGKPMVYYRSKF